MSYNGKPTGELKYQVIFPLDEFLVNSMLENQKGEDRGAKIIERLSHNLQEKMTEESGGSSRNLNFMRRFTKVWGNVDYGAQKICTRTVKADFFINLGFLIKLI